MTPADVPKRPRRSVRPAMVAPLIPIWGLLAFLGLQQFSGTRWLAPFLVLVALSFLGLFGFVARQVLSAKRLRRATRRLVD